MPNKLMTPEDFFASATQIWRECWYRCETERCEEERTPEVAGWLDDGGAL